VDTMGGNVDQSSDVYSLGVLLYELLIGAVPFDAATLRSAGLAEMLRIIREDEAPSLSRRLTSLGAAVTDIAERRQTDPVSLRRLVDGDLNSITMKALEKARERRYVSVADLAADIQNHLEHRPVLAAPPGLLYRTRKFLRRHRAAALGAAAGLVLLVSIGVTAWSLSFRGSSMRPTLTERDTIVLVDFTNQTGEPLFDGALRQGLSFELEQAPFAVISDAKVQETLALMGQPRDAPVTPELAQQICERTASAATLEGSIARLGSEYVLSLRARDCTTGRTLDQQQIQTAREEGVISALSQIARRFRTRAGESLTTVERRAPLAETTTSSIEALKAYSAGARAALASGSATGIPFYRRAVELDPEFAMAHARLGLAYSSGGESELSAESTRKAWLLRERISDRERFFIDFTYDRQITGNLEKAYQTLELWFQTYPRAEPNPRSLLGGVSTHGTGRYDRAIESSRTEIAADPDFGIGYGNLAGSYFFTGRFADAERTIQAASERKLGVDRLVVIGYNVGALKGDQAQMDRLIALARSKRRLEHWMTHAQSLALARSGRLQAARRSSNRAVELALQEGQRGRAATYLAVRATWEALCGNAGEGTRQAMAALEGSNGREVVYAAALALNLGGLSPRSVALADDLEQRFPEDTFVKFTYAPVLRGLAELRRGNPEQSVERLQVALRYELATNGLNFEIVGGGLHSAYVRGEALMAARRHAEAAAEFQKVLDHPGIVGTDPIGVLAHLQLGRVFALSGDRTRAKAAYETFLALWKDADADIPVLKHAKAEYARL
jgi:eukaryotic-like serine/threonine-protein kinase